ncbi:MAG TPA: hypothetical protein VG389_04330 [Myxococcota bacterium]|nr:hypothetical protein [Myxococcota bacterium]
MSVSYLIVVPERPEEARVAAVAKALGLVRDDAGGARAALSFRGTGTGTARAVDVELCADEAERVVAVRTASGRSPVDAWLQARLALALLEALEGRLASGERVTLEALRALARSAPSAAMTAAWERDAVATSASGAWARRHLRPLGSAAAFVLASAGVATLLGAGRSGARAALVLFVGAALAALLAFADRRARPR